VDKPVGTAGLPLCCNENVAGVLISDEPNRGRLALSQRQVFTLLTRRRFGCGITHKSSQYRNEPTINAVPQMNLFQAVVLGMVQGLTEFLPISSTAHLKVVPVVLGWGDPGVAFTAVIQLGSIAAVLWYFWRDLTQITTGAIKAIARSDYRSNDFRIALGIVLGTVPIVCFGLLIKAFIPDFDNSPVRSLAAIAVASIGMSLLLGLSEQLESASATLPSGSGWSLDGLGSGSGINSRSLVWFNANSWAICCLERATAARFSFFRHPSDYQLG